jgi:hypothetical protein
MERKALHETEEKLDVKAISYIREGGAGGRRKMEGGHPAALPTKLKSVLIRFGQTEVLNFKGTWFFHTNSESCK